MAFEAKDVGAKLTFVALEEDPGWWQNLLETVSAMVMAKKMQGMLGTIDVGVERQAFRQP